jgi:WD40 repeat protein/serine/threonine protein kinase
MFAPRITADSVLRHYEVIRSLGRGGMGEVFLARDTQLGRLVAIKLLTRRSGDPAEHVPRFLLEARATAQLSHESIVIIHELGEHEGTPFMVLEYLKGKTLQEILQERRRQGIEDSRHDTAESDHGEDEPAPEPVAAGLPPGRIVELMIPVVRALVCAHEHGIVHRDLKPSNIMVTDAGVVKVLDFGLAKLLDDPAGPASTHSVDTDPRLPIIDGPSMTQTGKMLGTKPYMSPEQWALGAVDHRTDIWATGIILAELSLGRHPLAPLSLFEMASIARLDVPMPSLRKLAPQIGKLGSVIDRCLIKAVEDRVGSARELLAELESLAPAARRASARDTGGTDDNPYPGLAAFQTGDAARFFGRGAAVAEVITQLGEQPLLAIVGPSGAGKSSFVRAGVIPALERTGDTWEAFTIRPGARPVAALAELLQEEAFHSSRSDDGTPGRVSTPSSPNAGQDGGRKSGSSLPPAEDREGLALRLHAEPGLLGARMRAHARSKRKRLFLFVDQAEELYTLAPEHERTSFFACLSGVADDPGSPLRVVLAMRSDFLDRMADARAASSALRRGLLLLPSMDRDALRDALVRPLEAADHRFESPALVDEMLDALKHTRAALPLLSFTASRLWAQRDRVKRVLTEASYRRLGGVGGALAAHADAVLGAMSGSERKLAREALLRLVTPERTRATAALRELRDTGPARAEMERVIGRLVDARLLTVEGGESEATVELVHESLIAGWPTLAAWVTENQADAAFLARLRHAAREWEAGSRSEDLLWRGQAAEGARRWHSSYSGELASTERRYVEAVIALSDRARRTRRAIAAAVTAALAIVAVTVSILAVLARRSATQANDALAKAKVAEKEARDRAIDASDARLLAGFRELKNEGQLAWGTKLLADVQRPEAARDWIALASDAAASSSLFVTLRGHEKEILLAAWSHDGQKVLTASADGTARAWNADGSGAPELLVGASASHPQPLTAVAFSRDGTRLLTAWQDGTAQTWSADGRGALLALADHSGPVTAADWSPDGRRLVTVQGGPTARVWDTSGTAVAELSGHTGPLTVAVFLPDGERVLTASDDGTARVWPIAGAAPPVVLRGHRAEVIFAAPSPDGTRIVTTSADRTARIWSASGNGPPVVLEGHAGNVVHAAWSPDGARVATAANDKTAWVWSADGTGEPVVLSGHGRAVTFVSFRPDGRFVATASRDRTARVWPAGGGKPLVLTGHSATVAAATWSPDGQWLLTAAGEEGHTVDPSPRIWHMGRLEPLPRGQWGLFHSAALAPAAGVVALACDDGTARLARVDGEGEPVVFRGHDSWVAAAVPSPDGKRVVTLSFDKTARIHFADGLRSPIVHSEHTAAVRAAAWSPNGTRLVTASDDGTARLLAADGSGAARVLSGHGDAVLSVAWSPDGRRIVTTSMDHTARVWDADLPGGSLLLEGHLGPVLAAAWSPDGARVVTASEDGTARIWDAGTGLPAARLEHASPVVLAVWSPDGKRLATSPQKGGLHVFRADGAGDPIVLEVPAPALALAFVEGSERLFAVLSDDTTRTFLLAVPDLKAALQRANADCLPPAMRATYLGERPGEARDNHAACERGHRREPLAADASAQAPPNGPAQTAKQEPSKLPRLAPDERRAALFVLPGDASVEVDGQLVQRWNGVVELVGKVGDVRRVSAFKGSKSIQERLVTIQESGASPSLIDLNEPSPRPLVGGPRRGVMRFSYDE